MKNIICFLLFFSGYLALGQTKEELIQKIIDYNVFESNCVGIACSPSEQFNRFEKLMTLISEKELMEFSRHKEPVIRAYASAELIKKDEDVIKLFSFEIDKNESVETQDGCIGGFDELAWIIYNAYKWKVASKAVTKMDKDEDVRKSKIEQTLINDVTFQKLDSIILHSDKDLYYMFYYIILKGEKVNKSLFPVLKELAFTYNNSFAFDCISDEYPDEVRSYFQNDFLQADFNSPNKVMYLDRFVEYLLNSENENYKSIAIQKLEKDDSWKKYLNFIEGKLKKHNVVLGF
ncbi:hypothetical protein [Chryseobacterium turcicum]|uniref:Uncharacterized protein n=1 Tax=Chryseobacterium turcicum TaxID=2898076 RepID=A0A9Q3V402_9FLAO|nr:hypothetical protein [Chryseobacterium turcicum]MCD1116260.1 hypothetical protein [Chryseobacterium turcicum]